jgi:hypothetical protein
MAIACITGASSGIGKEFALQLSELGYNLILISRHTKAIKEYAGKLPTKCKIISCDLSDQDDCIKLAKRLRHYKISVLINNAGFGELGAFAETKLKNDLNMIDLNVKSVHILTKAVLPGMVQRDEGYILNVASVAGLMPGGPYMSTYYATKAYVVSLTNAIHQEVKEFGSNVSVSALCPGPVDTNFNKRANVEFALKGITSQYCVSYALYHMFRKRLIIIPKLEIRLATLGMRFLPRKLGLVLLSRQQHRKTS